MLGRFAVLVVEDVGVGLQEEADVRVTDALADDLRTHPSPQRAGGVGVAKIVKRDAGQPSPGRQTFEALADRIRMWRTAVGVGEHEVTWVVGVPEELPLGDLLGAPLPQGTHRRLVDGDGLVGVAGLATGLIHDLAADDHPVGARSPFRHLDRSPTI